MWADPTISVTGHSLLLRDPHVHSAAKPFFWFKFPPILDIYLVADSHYTQYDFIVSN